MIFDFFISLPLHRLLLLLMVIVSIESLVLITAIILIIDALFGFLLLLWERLDFNLTSCLDLMIARLFSVLLHR